MADSDDDTHISISPVVFYLLLGAAGFGGLGGGSVISSQAEKPAIQACVDKSEELFRVAVQHGEELQTLRTLIYDRTKDRYTAKDAQEAWAEQYRRDAQQDRTVVLLEKEIKE